MKTKRDPYIIRPVIVALVLAMISAASVAQETLSQTLPSGFECQNGNTNTSIPFNTPVDQIWQWHYDASNFASNGPIEIREISVRASGPAALVQPFGFPNMGVTLIEASTDYTFANHATFFAANVRHGLRVKDSAFNGGPVGPSGGLTAPWIPFGLDKPFVYDPSSGRDLIVQVRTCGTNSAWFTNLDCATGAPGTVKGNRYGNTFDCNAFSYNFSDNETVPIVKIDYVDVHSLALPQPGLLNANGNAVVSSPFAAAADQTHQWHYENLNFAGVTGPIAITQLYVRTNSNAQVVSAFDFSDVTVRLAESSTFYIAATHSTVFANNILRSEIVRSGPYRRVTAIPPTGSGVGTWVSLQLERPFIYDPTAGNDFIVEIRKCGSNVLFGGPIDAASGSIGFNGGNTYFHATSCIATSESNRSNERVPVIRLDYVPAIITDYPYLQDFDASGDTVPPGWTQSSTDSNQDWILQDGSTGSVGTGPNGDHGTISAGHYAYVEDSGFESAAITLVSPWFDLAGLTDPYLSCWAHSVDSSGGATANGLNFDIENASGTIFSSVLPTIGDLGVDEWTQRVFDLAGFLGQTIRVHFRGSTDNGTFTHDIAIDEVRVFDRVNLGGQVPQSNFAVFDINEAVDTNGIAVGAGSPGLAGNQPGPYFARTRPGDPLVFHFEGQPNQPVILLSGSLSTGLLILPGIGQFDIGSGISGGVPTGLFPIAAGTSPNLPGSLFQINPLGVLDVAFTVPVQLLGQTINMQSVVFTGTASVIRLSNAVQLVVDC